MVNVFQSKFVIHRKKNSDEREKSSQKKPFDVCKEKKVFVENASAARIRSKTPVEKQTKLDANE